MSDRFVFDPRDFSGCLVLLQLGEGGRTVSGFFRVSMDMNAPPNREDCEARVRAVVPSLDLGRTRPGEAEIPLSSSDVRGLVRREAADRAKTGRPYEYLWVIDPERIQ